MFLPGTASPIVPGAKSFPFVSRSAHEAKPVSVETAHFGLLASFFVAAFLLSCCFLDITLTVFSRALDTEYIPRLGPGINHGIPGGPGEEGGGGVLDAQGIQVQALFYVVLCLCCKTGPNC